MFARQIFIVSQHQRRIFSSRSAQRILRGGAGILCHGGDGGDSNSEQHACAGGLSARNREVLVGHDATEIGRTDGGDNCATGRVFTGKLGDGYRAAAYCEKETAPPDSVRFRRRARADLDYGSVVAFETSGTECRSLNGVDRYGKTRAHGAGSAGPRHARSGGDSLDSAEPR